MNWVNALAGGAVGALIGAAAWIAVGYFGVELGLLAVGVGITSGIGVAMGAQGKAGTPGGILAALCAMFAIVGARYVLVQFEIDSMIRQAAAGDQDAPGPEDSEYWTAFLADRIVSEREEAGENIDWPDDFDTYEDGERFNDYPADIWTEARTQWDAVPVSEREEFCMAASDLLASQQSKEIEDFRTAYSIIGVLIYNFQPMALVIMGIAMVGAFQIAKNSRPANEGAIEVTNFDATQPSGLPGMPAAKPTGSSGIMNRPLPGDPLDRVQPGAQPRVVNTPPPSESAPLGLPGMPPPGSLQGKKDRFAP